MKLLSIVPARGGSKRLPGKNTKPLMGKPLLWHTLDAVIPHSETIIITTDCNKILRVASIWKNNNAHKNCNIILHDREAHLASDTSKVLETVVHLVEHHSDFDMVGLFLPTAPLRKSDDVNKALLQLKKSNADGIISTTHYEFPPTLSLVMDPDGLLHCADKSLPFITGNTRSQDHVEVLRPNGAIYLKYMKAFQRDLNFFKGRVLSYFMSREKSIDIDTKIDFKVAKLLWKN
jgi:CMP-N-acetylneuraminic acid synthetase